MRFKSRENIDSNARTDSCQKQDVVVAFEERRWARDVKNLHPERLTRWQEFVRTLRFIRATTREWGRVVLYRALEQKLALTLLAILVIVMVVEWERTLGGLIGW